MKWIAADGPASTTTTSASGIMPSAASIAGDVAPLTSPVHPAASRPAKTAIRDIYPACHESRKL
jgi:hypothetical protein